MIAMKEKYLLTLKAEDRPGLLHLVTGVLNRKLIPIISLTAAPTDIHDIVLITMELEVSVKALEPLLYKLENIIEVFKVEAIQAEKAICQRSAYFKLDKAVLASPQASAITSGNAQVISFDAAHITVSKSGSDAAIRQLYNALEGPYLSGFSQTGLIVVSKLIGEDESSVINRLAA